MSSENVVNDNDGSSTEYWPASDTSVAGSLSPASILSDESEWEILTPTIEDPVTTAIPAAETVHDINAEFIGYVEQFLMQNLYSLSPVLLWNLYMHLSIYFSMIANLAEIPCVVEVSTMEGDVNDPTEGELEPPTLLREQ